MFKEQNFALVSFREIAFIEPFRTLVFQLIHHEKVFFFCSWMHLKNHLKLHNGAL